jgi:hypothetical protein
MVMRPLAGDVGMVAAGQVDALDSTDRLERLERAEHRCPSDAQPPLAGRRHELGGREVAGLVRDERRKCTARLRHPEAGSVECVEELSG